MKTVLEPETPASAPAVSQPTKVREQRVNGVQSQQRPNPPAAVRPEDSYESCLDLSALFLPRG